MNHFKLEAKFYFYFIIFILISYLFLLDAHYNQTGNNIGELDMHYGLLNAVSFSEIRFFSFLAS